MIHLPQYLIVAPNTPCNILRHSHGSDFRGRGVGLDEHADQDEVEVQKGPQLDQKLPAGNAR